ncbi:MAG: hypothetical protein E7012_02910 [Alphaproteobacteria bacterium]|nr:hypothetical protein [Alphaproteobacteria bacterium]
MLLEKLKNIFLQPRPLNPEDISPEEALLINFKVVIVEFADNVESSGGEKLTSALKSCEGISAYYFDQPFDKTFLNLESRTLFDLVDKGQNILDKSGADVLIWGKKESDKIRINFQTPFQYENSGDSFSTLLDSLYLPSSIFENSAPFPTSLLNLLYGAIISSLNLTDKTRQIQKRYLLKKIIKKLSTDNSAKSLSIEYIPFVMNFLGLIYLNFCGNSPQEKDLKIVKNLLETALAHSNQLNNPIHLGNIYHHIGQMYYLAATHIARKPINSYRNAISNYRLAQKYLSKYNYPYDYGLISYKLSELFYNYWRQKEDLQALRDAVFHLRESERTFTYALFPDFWAQIQGRLGYLLTLLSNAAISNEIADLAIAAYKNQQKIVTENRDPVLWAEIQEKIGDIYLRQGKKEARKEFFEEALEYFHDALYIFENMNKTTDIQRLTASIKKTTTLISYH